jgi:hypothetical protein
VPKIGHVTMEGESSESVVQGVSTKVNEKGLDKYTESGRLIEKGCTERTAVSPSISGELSFYVF